MKLSLTNGASLRLDDNVSTDGVFIVTKVAIGAQENYVHLDNYSTYLLAMALLKQLDVRDSRGTK